VRLSYSMFSVKELNGASEGDDNVDRERVGTRRPGHSFGADYRFVLNRTTVFDFSSAVVSTDTDRNYLYGMGVGRRIHDIWFDLGYKRTTALSASSQAEFANGISGRSYFDVIQFGAHGQPLPRVGVEVSGLASRATTRAGIKPANSLVARGRLDYRLTSNVVAFVQLESYQQNSNAYVATPVSRARFFTGIEYSLSPESDRRTSRLNRDAQYVALTERGRKRDADK
jgi:hypothetical protein